MIATKATLTEAIQSAFGKGPSKALVERRLNIALETLKRVIKKHKILKLMGLGTFRVVNRKARPGVNPKTGTKIKIKASKTIRFTPSSAFKKSL